MGLFDRIQKNKVTEFVSGTHENIKNNISTTKEEKQKEELCFEVFELLDTINELKAELVETEEKALLQSFGFYTPHYFYETSDEYKEKLKEIRDVQKSVTKNGNAVKGYTDWEINGSKAEGRKMVQDLCKLILRAFNAECDDAIEHVRFNNIEACEKKINNSANAISKLGQKMSIYIADNYRNLKIAELRLMHEYQLKKQQEKEEAQEIRRQQKEEAKVLKEIEEARQKLEKEKSHYENALAKLNRQIENATEEELQDLNAKKEEIKSQIMSINNDIENVDYREANQKAGYVYIISNIGAFGENVYKIGMTRRLDPTERISELGDASVPFNFDVHAMIFTDDAPKLEAALHNAFADRKLNFINQRREFFNVSLDEIKAVIRENYDKTVEFTDIAPAEQYRESLLLRGSKESN